MGLYQQDQLVPYLKAQVVGDPVSEDVLQRDQLAVRLSYIGILRVEGQVELPGIFRLLEIKEKTLSFAVYFISAIAYPPCNFIIADFSLQCNQNSRPGSFLGRPFYYLQKVQKISGFFVFEQHE